ncbi:hypothetical protein PSCT_04131 [Pseudomonas sp. SCT]|jgi:hypothetical protein|nr:hypothetical protein PSCT_04131 [Pseudomonas sp. SCT]
MSLLINALVMSCVAFVSMLLLAWLAYGEDDRKG